MSENRNAEYPDIQAAIEELWRIRVTADNGAEGKLEAIKRYADLALEALRAPR